MTVELSPKSRTIIISDVPVPEGTEDFVQKEMLASGGIALRDAHAAVQQDDAELDAELAKKQAEIDHLKASRPIVSALDVAAEK